MTTLANRFDTASRLVSEADQIAMRMWNRTSTTFGTAPPP